MILETNGPLIAEKVTSHTIDSDSALSEQVVQHFFFYQTNNALKNQVRPEPFTKKNYMMFLVYGCPVLSLKSQTVIPSSPELPRNMLT